MINKPNFFIVGTPKAGTTSIFNYLEAHPEVFVPKIKEPHFFSTPEILDTYYNAKIITDKNKYLNLYKDVKTENAIGDLSTSYLVNEKSAKRIKQFNPEAKIIIVLRNPVDRAISHYLMDKNLGYIDIPLIEIINNRDKHPVFYNEYINLGYYKSQINNYYNTFDKTKVKVIISDDLFLNALEVISNIYKFIGVDKNYKPDTTKSYNQYRKPKFEIVKKIARSKQANYIISYIPEGLKSLAKTVLYSDSKKPTLIKERELLKEIYKESIIETSQLINRDLGFWI